MNTTKNLSLIIISVLAFLFTFSPSINTEAGTNRNTSTQTAEQLYKQGKSSFMQFTPEGFKNAIAYYNKAIQLNPNYAPAYAGLAEVYSFMGLYRYEVKQEYEEYFNQSYINILKALELGPSLPETQRALAYNYLHLSRENDAKETARRVLKAKPDDAESYYIIWAASGQKINDPDIRKAMSLNPNLVMAHIDLGTSLFFKKRDYKNAAIHYKKAVDLADSPQLRTYLGTTFRTQGYYTQAIDQYRKALELDPNYAPAHMNLGITLFYIKKFNEAITRANKAVVLNPKHPDSYFFLAQSYQASNNRTQAIKNYEIFIKLVSDQDRYSGYVAKAKANLVKLNGGAKKKVN